MASGILLVCVALLSSQSLVELAKKEKERRAKLKDKSAKVITNADLENRDISPALTVRSATPQPSSKKRAANPPRTNSRNPRVIMASDNQQQDQQEARGGSLKFATSVLPTTWYVDDPELALKKPDNRYAKIKALGYIDLELRATNNKGNDIAIYAKRQAQGIPNVQMNYIVYVKPERGDWVGIGMGTGVNAPERFDLGEVQSISAIRLVYKEVNQQYLAKEPKAYAEDYSMALDAVEALNIP